MRAVLRVECGIVRLLLPRGEGACGAAGGCVRRGALEALEVGADVERATMPAGSLLPCCRESYTPVNPAHQGRKLMCARWIGYLCGLNLFLLGLDTASQLL